MTQQSILRLPEVKQRTGLSRSSIYNAIKAGSFPSAVLLGVRAMGWKSNEIDSWIENVGNPIAKTAQSAPLVRKRRTR